MARKKVPTCAEPVKLIFEIEKLLLNLNHTKSFEVYKVC